MVLRVEWNNPLEMSFTKNKRFSSEIIDSKISKVDVSLHFLSPRTQKKKLFFKMQGSKWNIWQEIICYSSVIISSLLSFSKRAAE